MAAEFDTARVVVQPTQQEQPIPTDVFGTGASVFGQQASTLSQEAEQQTRRGESFFSKASAGFDKALEIYNKYAEQKATEDAPQSIKRDGNGNIIPPSSFYPPGISSRAYAESYKATSMALYKSYAEQELVNHSAVLKEQYPSDPTAYAVGMNQKRAAMQTNLDPAVAPWINIRGEQIQAQGITQIAVANQSAKNVITNEQYRLKVQGITDRAGGLVANTSQAQGGGGSEGGFNNNVGNIVSSGDGYSGGKGLPYLHPNGRKFETFQSAEQGVAAAYSLVKNKVDAAGGMTFEELISGKGTVKGWDAGAPALNKANYAAKMAEAAGLKPGDAVPIGDDAKMAQVIKAMNVFEKGKTTVSDASFENGIKLAKGDKNIPLSQPSVDAVRVPDARQLTEAANNAVNTGTIAADIAEARTLGKAAGRTDDQINDEIGKIRFNAQMKGITEQIKNSSQALYGLDGNPNPGAVADLRERIRTIAASPEYRDAGRSQQVLDTLERAVGEAQQQAQLRASQIQVNDQRAAVPATRQMMADQAAAKLAALNGDTVTATNITRNLEQRTRDYLTNTSISDSVAMKLGQAGFSAGAVSRGALQEANSNRLQSLNAILADTNPNSSSPQMKAQAEVELRAIKNDPGLMRDLTAGQRSYLQSGLDMVSTRRLAADTAGIRMSAPTGDISPVEFDAMLAKRVASGIDGNHVGSQLTLPEQAQLSAINRDAFNKRQANHDLARDAAARAAAGQTPTAAQIAAVNAADSFKLPGEVADLSDPAHGLVAGKPNTPIPETFDPAKPGHTATAIDFMRRYNFMPPRVKDAIDAMPITPNQQQAQPWIDLYKEVYNLAAEKVVQRTGERPTDADLKAQVAATIGPTQANYLAIAVRNGELGAETAYKATRDPKASVTGNTGQPTAGAVSAIDTASATYLKTITDEGAKSSVLNKLLSVRVPGTEGWQPTPAERSAATAFQSGPQTRPGFVENVIGRPLFGTGMPSTVTMTGEANEVLKQRAGDLVARDGQMIRMGITSGTVEDHAYRTVADQMLNDGQLEMRRDPNDPTKGIIGLKSANKDWAERMGLERLDDSTTRAVATQIYRAENRISGGATPDFDPKTVTVTPYLNDAGKPFYYIGATEKRTGMLLKLMDLSANDPRFNAVTMAADRSAMLTLQKNLVSEDGKPVDAETAANLGVAFSRMVQAPFQGILKEHYVAGAVMNPEQHKAFTDEMTRRMVEIRKTEGLPVKINWEKSLQNIANDQTPDSGRNGMIREIARQESAKKEAERTSQPAPGPVQGIPVPPPLSSPVIRPPKPTYP